MLRALRLLRLTIALAHLSICSPSRSLDHLHPWEFVQILDVSFPKRLLKGLHPSWYGTPTSLSGCSLDSAPYFASVSAFSLPLYPECPGIQAMMTLFVLASSFTVFCAFLTSAYVVLGFSRALIEAWLSVQIRKHLPSTFSRNIFPAHVSIAAISA